jgi:hypothetical protein
MDFKNKLKKSKKLLIKIPLNSINLKLILQEIRNKCLNVKKLKNRFKEQVNKHFNKLTLLINLW